MQRLPEEYFERRFRENADPWGFETRWYERRKYNLVLAALPQARYASAFEPGCANGAFSELLAARCDKLLCSEIATTPAAQAERRLRAYPHVKVERAAI